MHALSGWVLLTFGDDRGYVGNPGYADDPARIYRYDSFVPNHTQLKVGDVALVRGKTQLLGIAQIHKIQQKPGRKEQHRCPTCGLGNFGKRLTTNDHRCRDGHVFSTPAILYRDCVDYEADFGKSFIPAPGALSIDELREACLRYNRQMAMQRIDLQRVAGKLFHANPATEPLLRSVYLGVDDAAETPINSQGGYQPTSQDTREELFRAIRARRGQPGFRESLRQRYGDACMISGCALMDVVEAAHISPFRGTDDHHPENGLLLRADLHTLFDLDLLGIEPSRLEVHLHPGIVDAGYACLKGLVLHCNQGQPPSRAALHLRWSLFLARSGSLFTGPRDRTASA